MAALFVALLTMGLAACGGGGGGSAEEPTRPGGQTSQPPVIPSVGIAITAISGSPALVGGNIQFAAQASGGTAPFVYLWSFGDGSSASGGEAQHAYAAAGTFPITVTVTDAQGKTATSTSEVRVDAPLSVAITASRLALSINQDVQLTATHEPSPDIDRYEWKFGNGMFAQGQTVSARYSTIGTYQVELTVVRKDGRRFTASLTLSTVATAPTLYAWDVGGRPYAGLDHSFDSNAPGLENAKVVWDFGDGTTQEAAPGLTTHRYREAGTYKVRATVTNSTGASASVSFSLNLLAPMAPSAVTVRSSQALTDTQAASASVTLTAVSATESGGSELDRRYVWDFGDGSPATAANAGQTVEHRFPGPGTYVVTLTATNAFGLSSSGTATVVVGQRQQAALLAGRDLKLRQVDGPALTATFDTPSDISFDAVGNLFIVDSGNAAVRKLSRDGRVSTVDIGGAECIDGATASFLKIAPYGDGNVFTASWWASCRRKVLWETKSGAAAVNRPVPHARGDYFDEDDINGMVVTPTGQLMAMSLSGTVLRRMEPDGRWTDVAGKAFERQRSDGVGPDARILAGDQQLTVDAQGSVYYGSVTTVHRISQDGTVRLMAGQEPPDPWLSYPSQDGVGTQARFRSITALAAAPDGTVYVLDAQKLRKITPDGTVTTLPVDFSLYGHAGFWAIGLAVSPDGSVVVSDGRLNIIRRVNSDFSLTTIAGSPPESPRLDGVGDAAAFNRPQGIVQGPSGALYVADGNSRAIRKVLLDGTVTTLAIIPTPPVYLVNGYPSLGGLVLDANENLYVADSETNAVYKVTADGTVTLVAGRPGSNGWRDGPASVALLNAPVGIARDGAGNLYVSDAENHVIRKITPSGNVSTVAGTAFSRGTTDGIGAAARFSKPTQLVAEADGTLWVADTENNAIRKVTPAGEVSTVVGTGTSCGGRTHEGTKAVCTPRPYGLTRDAASGDLYYADSEGLWQLKADGTSYGIAVTGPYRVRLGALPAARLGNVAGVALLSNGQIAVTSGNMILVTTK